MTLGTNENPIEILLVEDNPGDIELAQRVINSAEMNCRVSMAEDGEVAMAFLHKRGQHASAPRPHLILLDLAMPKKDGFEVLAEINADANLKSIPVMILTSRQSDRDLVQSLGVPPSRYSGKPLELTRFNIILNQARAAFTARPEPAAARAASQPAAEQEQPQEQPKKSRKWWWPFG